MIHTVAYDQKSAFQDHYLAIRAREGRVYSDVELLDLPRISRGHRHYREWIMREESTRRLKSYFEKKRTLLKILEVGCGNGWLAHNLAYIAGADIIGTDVNFPELQQGARVFSHIPNLRFVYGGLDAKEIAGQKFDFIVFASSIQYFESVKETIECSFEYLRNGGEIHILDTAFYKLDEAANAKKRTEAYYQKEGFPEMANYYYHHCIESLKPFSPRILYTTSFINRHLFNNINPFQWISISKPT